MDRIGYVLTMDSITVMNVMKTKSTGFLQKLSLTGISGHIKVPFHVIFLGVYVWYSVFQTLKECVCKYARAFSSLEIFYTAIADM